MSEQPKCTLRDAELLADVEKWVSKLCDPGGRAWTLSVPVNFNRDPDMLITELCKRYASLLARHNALVEAVAWERECGTVSFTDLWFDEWNRTEDQSKSAMQELRFTRRAARSEVDRLIGEVLCAG